MAFLPNSSSNQQHHLIPNPLATHGSDVDPVHPPGVPLYSAPMQQTHENIHNPYGYLPSSVPGWLPVHNNAPTAFDPNSMQPVQILEHQQYSGSNNSGLGHLGFLHPQQIMDTHSNVSYFYGGEAPTQYTMSGPACPAPLFAPPRRVRQHKAPQILAWCELCRVDCSNLENLEKHKQGKKHKKHMKVFNDMQTNNDMQNNNEALTGAADNTTPLLSQPLTSQLKLTGKVGEEEEEVPVVLNEVQKQADPSKKEEGVGYNLTHPTSIKKVKKRKKRSCIEVGATTEQPNITHTWECKMCNTSCNSQVVFDTHLAGRKHLTNLVRLHGRHSTTVNILNSAEPVAQRPADMVNLHGDAAMVQNLNPPQQKFKRQKQVKTRFHRYNHSSTIKKSQRSAANISATETPAKGEEEHPTMEPRMETNAPEIEPTVSRLDQCSNEEPHPSTAPPTDEKHMLPKTDQTYGCILSDKSSLQSPPEECS